VQGEFLVKRQSVSLRRRFEEMTMSQPNVTARAPTGMSADRLTRCAEKKLVNGKK